MKERATKEDLNEAVEIADMLLSDMKESKPDFYDHIVSRLYERVYGKKLTEEYSKKIVSCMEPFGEHWNIEQVKGVMSQYGISLDPVDFYTVMNMAYNDYHELFEENLDMYIKYSKMFIEDKDAKEGKVYTYFTSVTK